METVVGGPEETVGGGPEEVVVGGVTGGPGVTAAVALVYGNNGLHHCQVFSHSLLHLLQTNQRRLGKLECSLVMNA